ncbi:hypothetical protein D5086_025184 [Populus alba]|uniref:Uncharacterized protein n=1 Tax=Populus alba TaxID=43335 RepID=A0ACC4B888_POPAL
MAVKVAAQSATLARKPFVERLNAINFQSPVCLRQNQHVIELPSPVAVSESISLEKCNFILSWEKRSEKTYGVFGRGPGTECAAPGMCGGIVKSS